MPDPFSLFSYLEYMLTPYTWGEEIVLTQVSMMWQIRITAVYTERVLQERVRHNKNLERTDLVVVYCRGTHYIGAAKHSFHLQRWLFSTTEISVYTTEIGPYSTEIVAYDIIYIMVIHRDS